MLFFVLISSYLYTLNTHIYRLALFIPVRTHTVQKKKKFKRFLNGCDNREM